MAGSATVYASAVALFGVAFAAGADQRPVDPRELARVAARPLALPTAWARHEAAMRAGDPERLLAASRLLAGLLPEWTDARVQVAWTLAYDLGGEARDAAGRTALVLRAVDELMAAAESPPPTTGATSVAELWIAAAAILEDRCRADAEVARGVATRAGRDYAEVVHELVEHAVAAAPSGETTGRLAFVTARLVAGCLRSGDVERAEHVRQAALAQLRQVDPSMAPEGWVTALEELGDLRRLRADPARIDALAGDPQLTDIVAALRQLRAREGG
ncbi:MAG: hypothetical protein IPM29_08710 [Planctomycetes bacterium]|nr:hypothetical protein [Planctomycetota bacterium]